jgi:hypothetical protein
MHDVDAGVPQWSEGRRERGLAAAVLVVNFMGIAKLEATAEAFSDGDRAEVANDRASGKEVKGDGRLAKTLGGRGRDRSQRRDEDAGGAFIAQALRLRGLSCK